MLFRKKKITIKKKLIYHHKIELVILISAKEEMSVNQSLNLLKVSAYCSG